MKTILKKIILSLILININTPSFNLWAQSDLLSELKIPQQSKTDQWWCLSGARVPCGFTSMEEAKINGRCSTNAPNAGQLHKFESPGGYIANTAKVETTFLSGGMNGSYISPNTEICGKSHISGNTTIISGRSIIYDQNIKEGTIDNKVLGRDSYIKNFHESFKNLLKVTKEKISKEEPGINPDHLNVMVDSFVQNFIEEKSKTQSALIHLWLNQFHSNLMELVYENSLFSTLNLLESMNINPFTFNQSLKSHTMLNSFFGELLKNPLKKNLLAKFLTIFSEKSNSNEDFLKLIEVYLLFSQFKNETKSKAQNYFANIINSEVIEIWFQNKNKSKRKDPDNFLKLHDSFMALLSKYQFDPNESIGSRYYLYLKNAETFFSKQKKLLIENEVKTDPAKEEEVTEDKKIPQEEPDELNFFSLECDQDGKTIMPPRFLEIMEQYKAQQQEEKRIQEEKEKNKKADIIDLLFQQ